MREQLCDGLDKLEIKYETKQIDLCLAYCQLMLKWNKAFNLTAVKQPQKMVSYLLLDSLSVLPQLENKQSLVDVGTGAGLPGVPLAIFMPQSDWVLCDSNGKKTRFIRQACAELDLKNISVENNRIEDYHPQQAVDVILSKAYASLADFIQSVEHIGDENTVLMTLKSGLQAPERQAVNLPDNQLDEVFVNVPGILEPRSIVTIRRHKES